MMANEKKSRPASPNKKKFILSQSALSAKEVVDAAAKEGLKLTPGYVYVVRSQASVKARAPKAASKKAARNGPREAAAEASKARPRGKNQARQLSTPAKTAKGRDHAAAFVDLVLEIGLARAEALLREVRKVGPSVSARVL